MTAVAGHLANNREKSVVPGERKNPLALLRMRTTPLVVFLAQQRAECDTKISGDLDAVLCCNRTRLLKRMKDSSGLRVLINHTIRQCKYFSYAQKQ